MINNDKNNDNPTGHQYRIKPEFLEQIKNFLYDWEKSPADFVHEAIKNEIKRRKREK